MSDFDMQKYTNGSGKELGLHSQTIQEISKEYVIRRKQFKNHDLTGENLVALSVRLAGCPLNLAPPLSKTVRCFNRQYFKVWDSYGLNNYSFKSGSFNEDARGRWYFNVVVEIDVPQSIGKSSVGIDLGCKQAAMDSNGHGVTGRHYRKLQTRLGLAQRARNKRKAKAIHAKIKNRRKDDLHKYSRKLVNENAAIFVGNVNSKALTKTKMAKSVLDAGWEC